MKVSKDIVHIIEEKMKFYEVTYGIQVLMWSFRGSIDIGIYRKNSDLDIIFIYRSVNKNIRAIHDIVGHGFDYWGWLLEDVLTTIHESNKLCDSGMPYVISKEHERGSLDYYFGIYCGIDNELSAITEAFSKYIEALRSVCMNKAMIVWFNNKIEKIYRKIVMKQEITGNEYLYSVWYAYMCKHIMLGNRSGDNKLRKLVGLYATLIEKEEIINIHNDYKVSESKTAKTYYSKIINDIITNQYKTNKQYIFDTKTSLKQEEYENSILTLYRIAEFNEESD